MYDLLSSKEFDNKFKKLDFSIQKRLFVIKERLIENPYIGKQLHSTFFRELKIGKFRFYYLIYETYKAIYFVTLGEKKDQQREIDTVKWSLDRYLEEVKNLIKKH